MFVFLFVRVDVCVYVLSGFECVNLCISFVRFYMIICMCLCLCLCVCVCVRLSTFVCVILFISLCGVSIYAGVYVFVYECFRVCEFMHLYGVLMCARPCVCVCNWA